MPLIEGKCPNCGGLLQLKDDKKAEPALFAAQAIFRRILQTTTHTK